MKKDLIKTATYGAMHLVVAVAVAFALTGDLAIALGIGLLEPLVQTVFYNLHERAWAGRIFRRVPGAPGRTARALGSGTGNRFRLQPVTTS